MLTQSLESLTLEAVAKEAGIRKGGLLYQFPTKKIYYRTLLLYFLVQLMRIFIDMQIRLKKDVGREHLFEPIKKIY